VKFAALVPVPPDVVTVILPVEAVTGTKAVIVVLVFTVKVDTTAWNFTAVAPVNPVPLITTLSPMVPEAGANEVMVGAAASATPRPNNPVASTSIKNVECK
jgi:hypothetical protein